MLAAGKLSATANGPASDDPTRDVRTLAPDDMTSLQRRAARAVAEPGVGRGAPALQPQSLHRDLRARCGECVRLTGEELTLFRHESAERHGALPNASGAQETAMEGSGLRSLAAVQWVDL